MATKKTPKSTETTATKMDQTKSNGQSEPALTNTQTTQEAPDAPATVAAPSTKKKQAPASAADAPVKASGAVTKKKAVSAPSTSIASVDATPSDSNVKKVPSAKSASANKSTASSQSTASNQGASITKVYGEIEVSGNDCFIQKGSVSEGQLQLIPQKDSQEIMSRISAYNRQFVTVLGEFNKKKKTDKSSAFVLHNIASHDEIARRAYELSQENPDSVEDNWFRAENELLQQ